jgi:hypothetical protein
MTYEKYSKSINDKDDSLKAKKEQIMRMKLPKEIKEIAVELMSSSAISTHIKNGKVTGLELHPDIKKKIKDKNLPDGFSMGVDKDGFFIHTHRGRSKSYDSPGKISVKDIKFIDSTG